MPDQQIAIKVPSIPNPKQTQIEQLSTFDLQFGSGDGSGIGSARWDWGSQKPDGAFAALAEFAVPHSAAATLQFGISLGMELVQLARDRATSAASPSACSHTVESDSIPSHMSHVNALLQYTPKSRPLKGKQLGLKFGLKDSLDFRDGAVRSERIRHSSFESRRC